MISGFLHLVADVIAMLFVGAIPEREPWRTLLMSIYVAGALAGVAVLVWIIADAF